MKLLWSTRSPFARKVCVVAHELGISDQIELIPTVVASTMPVSDDVLGINPLGKIPALITDGESSLFDSRVICEHLDLLYGPRLFPIKPSERLQQLRWQALADGVLDILVLWRSELGRGDNANPAITENYERKVRASMARLASDAELLQESNFGIGQVAIVCALEYLEFRWAGSHWQTAFEALANWHNTVLSRPSVQATPFTDPNGTAAGAPVFTFDRG